MEDFLYFCNMEKVFIAGPCVIESAELLDTVAQEFVRIRQTLGVEIIFKASFDKGRCSIVRRPDTSRSTSLIPVRSSRRRMLSCLLPCLSIISAKIQKKLKYAPRIILILRILLSVLS